MNIKKKSIYENLDVIFITVLITIFFTYHITKISYGLPFFINLDEIEFQSSILSSLGFITGYFELNYNPFYAPLINIILMLKFIFINEFIINSLSLDQIKLKIYFNPELFIFYGRIASLTITSLSIFFVYLIFKKLKINFLIYGVLLITFASSLVVLNVSTIMSKNSCNLLIFTIQLYFFIKYLFKIEKFEFKSYIILSLLASLAWGVNYWPAFISLYGVLIFHYKRYKFSKIQNLFVFLSIFIILGPVVNYFFVNMSPLDHILYLDEQEKVKDIELILIINHFINNFFSSLKIIYAVDKNILLLVAITPFFLINKHIKLKKEFLILFFLIIGPLIIFGISGNFVPQLRYFGGVICVIIILTALTFNELKKINFQYLGIVIIVFNSFFIYTNFKQTYKIITAVNNNHSFFDFKKKIDNFNIDKSKVLFLVDLNFQESLKQNLYYLKLYENNLIKKTNTSKKVIKDIRNKIDKINDKKNIIINNEDLKEDITYFNYTYFPIDNFELFFDFINDDFDYVVIEESSAFYLSDKALQSEIKNFVKENLLFKFIQFEDDKIFLRSQQSIIHYYANTLTQYDFAENIENNKLKVIYGTNFSLYEL